MAGVEESQTPDNQAGPTSPTIPTVVLGTKVTKTPTGVLGGSLPMTGMEIFKTAAIGAGLIAAGTAMRVTTRGEGTPAADGPADEPDALTD